MMALQERSDKERHQHYAEMKELKRIISHDDKIKEFMTIKASDRRELKAEEAEKKRKMRGAVLVWKHFNAYHISSESFDAQVGN